MTLIGRKPEKTRKNRQTGTVHVLRLSLFSWLSKSGGFARISLQIVQYHGLTVAKSRFWTADFGNHPRAPVRNWQLRRRFGRGDQNEAEKVLSWWITTESPSDASLKGLLTWEFEPKNRLSATEGLQRVDFRDPVWLENPEFVHGSQNFRAHREILTKHRTQRSSL